MTTSESSESPRRPGWRALDVARAAIIVLLVYATARLIFSAHTLIFVAYLGVLLGLAVSAGARRLRRFGIPQGAGAGLIVAASIALLVGFGAWTGPTVRTQYRELRERLPEAFAKLDRWIGEREGGFVSILLSPATDSSTLRGTQTTPLQRQQSDSIAAISGIQVDSLSHINAIKKSILSGISASRGYVIPVIHSTIEAVTGLFLVLFLTLYIGADPDLYRRGILELVPHNRRARAGQVLDALGSSLRRWLTTQLIAMITLGAVTTLFLVILKVRAAVPLGILAGLLQFVPTVGPILSAIPSIAMAFIDSPEKAGAVAMAYYIIHFMETHLLIPILMKEGVNLPPILTILTQAGMVLTFGIVGLFVAVPVLVLVMILVKMLYVEDVIGTPTELPFTIERPPPPDVA